MKKFCIFQNRLHIEISAKIHLPDQLFYLTLAMGYAELWITKFFNACIYL